MYFLVLSTGRVHLPFILIGYYYFDLLTKSNGKLQENLYFCCFFSIWVRVILTFSVPPACNFFISNVLEADYLDFLPLSSAIWFAEPAAQRDSFNSCIELQKWRNNESGGLEFKLVWKVNLMVEFDSNLATRNIPVAKQTSNTACYVRIQHHHSYELYQGSDEMKTQKIQIWKGIWVYELCNISALSCQSPSSHIITRMGWNSALCKRLQSVWKQQWKHMECQIVITQNKYYFECKGN